MEYLNAIREADRIEEALDLAQEGLDDHEWFEKIAMMLIERVAIEAQMEADVQDVVRAISCRIVRGNTKVLEKVMEAIDACEFRRSFFEIVPMLMLWKKDCIEMVVDKYKQLLNRDSSSFIVPIVASLYDIGVLAAAPERIQENSREPTEAKRYRELIEKINRDLVYLCCDSLRIMEEDDVPFLVDCLLKMLQEAMGASSSGVRAPWTLPHDLYQVIMEEIREIASHVKDSEVLGKIIESLTSHMKNGNQYLQSLFLRSLEKDIKNYQSKETMTSPFRSLIDFYIVCAMLQRFDECQGLQFGNFSTQVPVESLKIRSLLTGHWSSFQAFLELMLLVLQKHHGDRTFIDCIPCSLLEWMLVVIATYAGKDIEHGLCSSVPGSASELRRKFYEILRLLMISSARPGWISGEQFVERLCSFCVIPSTQSGHQNVQRGKKRGRRRIAVDGWLGYHRERYACSVLAASCLYSICDCMKDETLLPSTTIFMTISSRLWALMDVVIDALVLKGFTKDTSRELRFDPFPRITIQYILNAAKCTRNSQYRILIKKTLSANARSSKELLPESYLFFNVIEKAGDAGNLKDMIRKKSKSSLGDLGATREEINRIPRQYFLYGSLEDLAADVSVLTLMREWRMVTPYVRNGTMSSVLETISNDAERVFGVYCSEENQKIRIVRTWMLRPREFFLAWIQEEDSSMRRLPLGTVHDMIQTVFKTIPALVEEIRKEGSTTIDVWSCFLLRLNESQDILSSDDHEGYWNSTILAYFSLLFEEAMIGSLFHHYRRDLLEWQRISVLLARAELFERRHKLRIKESTSDSFDDALRCTVEQLEMTSLKLYDLCKVTEKDALACLQVTNRVLLEQWTSHRDSRRWLLDLRCKFVKMMQETRVLSSLWTNTTTGPTCSPRSIRVDAERNTLSQFWNDIPLRQEVSGSSSHHGSIQDVDVPLDAVKTDFFIEMYKLFRVLLRTVHLSEGDEAGENEKVFRYYCRLHFTYCASFLEYNDSVDVPLVLDRVAIDGNNGFDLCEDWFNDCVDYAKRLLRCEDKDVVALVKFLWQMTMSRPRQTSLTNLCLEFFDYGIRESSKRDHEIEAMTRDLHRLLAFVSVPMECIMSLKTPLKRFMDALSNSPVHRLVLGATWLSSRSRKRRAEAFGELIQRIERRIGYMRENKGSTRNSPHKTSISFDRTKVVIPLGLIQDRDDLLDLLGCIYQGIVVNLCLESTEEDLDSVILDENNPYTLYMYSLAILHRMMELIHADMSDRQRKSDSLFCSRKVGDTTWFIQGSETFLRFWPPILEMLEATRRKYSIDDKRGDLQHLTKLRFAVTIVARMIQTNCVLMKNRDQDEEPIGSDDSDDPDHDDLTFQRGTKKRKRERKTQIRLQYKCQSFLQDRERELRRERSVSLKGSESPGVLKEHLRNVFSGGAQAKEPLPECLSSAKRGLPVNPTTEERWKRKPALLKGPRDTLFNLARQDSEDVVDPVDPMDSTDTESGMIEPEDEFYVRTYDNE